MKQFHADICRDLSNKIIDISKKSFIVGMILIALYVYALYTQKFVNSLIILVLGQAT